MGNYDFIARGLPPIDIASPLLQIEQIRRQRSMEDEYTRRTDLETKRYDDRAALEKRRYDETQEQTRKAEMANRTLNILKLVAASPNPQQTGMQYLPQIQEGLTALGVPFDPNTVRPS